MYFLEFYQNTRNYIQLTVLVYVSFWTFLQKARNFKWIAAPSCSQFSFTIFFRAFCSLCLLWRESRLWGSTGFGLYHPALLLCRRRTGRSFERASCRNRSRIRRFVPWVSPRLWFRQAQPPQCRLLPPHFRLQGPPHVLVLNLR